MKYFSLLLLFVTSSVGYKLLAQNYSLNNGFSNNQTITTCTGFFFDSSPTGNYNANENYTVSFAPSNANRVIQMIFSNIELASGDTLFIYDGLNTQNNLLDYFTSNSSNINTAVIPSDTNNTGALTFKFKSDGVNQNVGWAAEIKCSFPCKQRILGSLSSTPNAANGYVNICLEPTKTVAFGVNTNYPDNGTVYLQSDTSSYFHWFFGDGTDTIGKNLTAINHTYTTEGGYNVKLLIKDSNGCFNRTNIGVKVRTGIKPVFNIIPPPSVCTYDTISLQPGGTGVNGSSSVIPVTASFVSLPISGDSLFLPDGTGVVYRSNIQINQFNPGQTLTNINQLKGIYMNMEHSYLGDLSIAITAPNGVTVVLKNYPGGGECYLGEPVDEDSGPTAPNLDRIQGNGYTYWFSNSPAYGTMQAESNRFRQSFTDNAGRRQVDKLYLPSGSYASSNALSALVGTPLNGTWTLRITDNLAIDNGFLFNWKLDFDASLFPNAEVYQVPITSQNWVLPNPNIVSVTGNQAFVHVSNAGDYTFTYRVTDAFGCNYDTTVLTSFNPVPQKPNLGNDVTLCNGSTSVTLVPTPLDNTVGYTWNTGETNAAINANTIGNYTITAANSFNCTSRDSINVLAPQPILVNLGADTMFCASSPNLLKPIVSSNVISYLWNDNSTKDTLRINSPGTYTVRVTSNQGCTNTDEIIVSDNPVNSFSMPADTIICEKSSFNLTLNPPTGSVVTWNDGFVGYTKTLTALNTYTTNTNFRGCLKRNTYKVTSKPLPVINLGPDFTVCNSRTALLKSSYPGASYLWNDGTTDSFLVAKTQRLYWLEATFNQCKFRDSIQVNYVKCDCNTTIPNAFSPNGDGINDYFVPKMECVPRQYKLTIFTRMGQPVFETTNYLKSWDGNFNGKPLPVATYYYVITYLNEGLQLQEKFGGAITIIR